jgi:hypothetical protein
MGGAPAYRLVAQAPPPASGVSSIAARTRSTQPLQARRVRYTFARDQTANAYPYCAQSITATSNPGMTGTLAIHWRFV